MKVFIWSPLISEVGTTWTVINTAKAIKKYSKNKINCFLINVANEWKNYQKEISENNLNIIDLNSKLNFEKLPKHGFLKSRITYILIFFFSIIKLHKLLKTEKPDFIFVHLITPVPLILLLLFNYKTKFILRISGFPKLNLLRIGFWKLFNKKIFKVYSPTSYTKKILVEKKIFKPEKIEVVNEPILDLSLIRRKKNEISSEVFENKKEYIVSIGRLTKQKNYLFLINAFDKILKKNPNEKLIICGEGEEKNKLLNQINKLKRNNEIYLIGYKKNIYPILKNAKFFLLTSEWEDPGFVLVESMFSNKIVLSSDCKSGPVDLIKDYKNGFLYKKGNLEDFLKKFFEISDLIEKNQKQISKIKLNAKITSKKFTLFRHFLTLKRCLIEL